MNSRFVVALGSSAGGLQSLKTFFDHTPHDNTTYVVIRHIPIGHHGELHEILKRHSKLAISEAKDGELIGIDHIYMPPSSMYMTIRNNRLYLRPRVVEESTGNWSVNIFLESLAQDKGHHATAVILSGGGSDGAKGVTAIKKAGGLVIAQQPESCEHPSMVKNAIKTGNVDHILLPHEMPDIILKHANAIVKSANQFTNLANAGENN